jgi:hypothetical protein
VADDAGPGEGRYQVAVSGGKGVVIGDYPTVIQQFGEAPPPLSSQIRTREFAALVGERTREFVGREFVLRDIAAALADPDFTSGYVVLRGEPGIGKTAVLAQLVKEYGFVHHFNVAALGIRSAHAFLTNVCAQLIVRYKLEHQALPPAAAQDGGFLSRLLAEAADPPANRPVVVVVDALDEADETGLPRGANRLFLPPDLPAGVFVVASTREVADLRLVASSRRDLHLRDDDPRNLADVAAYVARYVREHAGTMGPRIEEWSVTADEFVDVLTGRSAGNFMYVVHVLRDIARGLLTAANVDDLHSLPQGLREYYRRHWNDMRAPDPEQFRRYQEPVVSLLATVREPVAVGELLGWTKGYWHRMGWDPRDLNPTAVRDVLVAWREFLNEEEPGGPSRYRIYHASFQDFLAEEVGLVAYHETIADTALAKIPGFGPA